jgi:lipopolysaccharide export system protein LptA
MKKSVIFSCFLFAIIHSSIAQVTNPNPADTSKLIEILRGASLRFITIDTTKFETIAGNVLLKQGGTLFSNDSSIINSQQNIIEAFGNIDINQGDTLHCYSQYLKYLGNERIAHLTKNVRLTDKKGTLFTEDLEYDLKTGIGKYNNGGKVVNGTTTLTSTTGTYYSDTKDVLFKNNVRLTDPKYKIRADSLLYNTQTDIATFIGPTHIKSKDFEATTTSGYYNMKTGEALFDKRSIFKDSTGTTFTADRTASDEKSGTVQMEGNAVVRDSANGYTVLAGQIFMEKKKGNSLLATRKPVLIIHRDKDSTYIAADTLYSSVGKQKGNHNTETTIDSLRKDSTGTAIKDSSIRTADTVVIDKAKYDTLKNTKSVNLNKDSIRYFLAFHHVRVFNDSMQSVSDSLYYSAEDSVFRLYQKPVVWSGQTQITGDTMYMFTKNKKAERLYVFENAIVVNRSKGNFYNQMGGKTLNGYFINGEMDYIRVKGSPAESVYYAQDKDSAYIGMNRASGEAIDLFFKKSELNKVKFVNDVKGALHPINKIPAGTSELKNFNWQDKRRPKNKLELFE